MESNMWVPVQLCAFALKYKLISEFKLYLYLKYSSDDGVCYIGKKRRYELALELLICEKSIRNHLKKLLDIGWVNSDCNKNYFIRGYKNLMKKTIKTDRIIFYNTRVEFSFMYFDMFRQFITGAVFGFFILQQKAKLRRTGRKKARSSKRSPKFYSMALIAMNGILQIPMSTLQKYFKHAVDGRFLNSQKSYKLEEKLDRYSLRGLKLEIPEEGRRLRMYRGKVYQQGPNMYYSNLLYKGGNFR